MQPICKICAASVEYGIVALFAKRSAIRRKWEKDCGALQDGALSGIASNCGVHVGISAAPARYAALISAAVVHLLHSF